MKHGCCSVYASYRHVKLPTVDEIERHDLNIPFLTKVSCV